MGERPVLPGFNVAKCVAYLRGIGCEIDDATAQSWTVTERVDRFLDSQRRSVRDGADMECRRGHRWYGETTKRRRKIDREANERAVRCPTCGDPFVFWALRWSELRDGSIRDYRPRSERWRALDAQPEVDA